MEFRNPIFNAFGGIDCEINHPDYGWIPHTIAGEENPQLYADALSASPSAYVAPIVDALAAERARMSVSRLQARLALGVDTCTALDAIADDAETPWAVRETIKCAATWYRLHPDMDVIGWAIGYEPEEIDALFRLAATL